MIGEKHKSPQSPTISVFLTLALHFPKSKLDVLMLLTLDSYITACLSWIFTSNHPIQIDSVRFKID